MATAICANCDSSFPGVDQDEDGFPSVPDTRRCNYTGCEVDLCRAGCRDLSFSCEGCGRWFCTAHRVSMFDSAYCPACAVEAVEANEPECGCHQTDVDLFDPRGCELHDDCSLWNQMRRQVTSIEQYERTGRAA